MPPSSPRMFDSPFVFLLLFGKVDDCLFSGKTARRAHHSQRDCLWIIRMRILGSCRSLSYFTDFVLLQGPAICSDIIITILFTTHFVVDSIFRYIFPKCQPTQCIMEYLGNVFQRHIRLPFEVFRNIMNCISFLSSKVQYWLLIHCFCVLASIMHTLGSTTAWTLHWKD